MSNTTVEQLLIRIDASSELLRRELKKADASVVGFDKNVGKQLKRIDRRFQRFSRGLSGLLAGAFSIYAAKRFFDYISESSTTMINLRAQLKLVSDSQEEVNTSFSNLLSISNNTGQTLDATITLYSRLARNTEDLAISQGELLRMTETLNKAFVVSGATGRESSNAMIQLSQAFGKGRLDGEELNAVMEQAPILAREIARSAGIGYGGLKQAAEEGTLTVDILIDAIQKLKVKIDRDFNEIPVTIERAMNELGNNLMVAFGDVDTGPLVESIQELSSTVGDPKTQENLRAIAAGIVSIADAMVRVAAWGAQATTSLSEFLAQTWGGADSSGGTIEQMIKSYGELDAKIKQVNKTRRAGSTTNKADIAERAKLKAILEIEGEKLVYVNEQWMLVDGTLKEATVTAKRWEVVATDGAAASTKSAAAAKAQAKALKEVQKFLKPYSKILKDVTDTIKDGVDVYDERVKQVEEYIEELEFEVSLLGETENAQALLRIEHEASAMAAGALKDRIVELNTTLYQTKKANEEAAAVAKKAADEVEAAWKGARDTLSDFFFEFARDGLSAFDTLVEGFKSMITKMIAEAAANQIILGIGTAAAGLGFSSVANAATASVTSSAAGSFLPDVGGAAASYFMGNSSLFSPVTAGNGIDASGWAAAEGASPVAGFNWANAAYGAAGGFAGGFASDKVFGDTSGLGNTAGALAGTLIPGVGPFLGPAFGSFLGGGVEKFLGDVFGFGGKPGNNIGFADLGTGETGGYGTYNPANEEAAKGIAEQIQIIAEALGADGINGRIEVSDRGWVRFLGEKYTEVEELFSAVIDKIIDKSKTLTGAVKKLVKGFDGTTDELITFAGALVSIDKMIKENPVDKAVKDFADSQAAASRTMMETYRGQLDVIYDLTYGFDGSTEAALSLNNAMVVNAQLAYDMATALKQIGESTKTLVGNEVDYFKTSVMTPDENLEYLGKQFEFLMTILPKLTDPGQIAAARDAALRINRQIFDLGPEDLQRANVGINIDAAKQIGVLTDQATENSLKVLGDSQRDLNQQVAGMLEVAAAGFQAPADTMYSAAELMYLAVQNFINGGGYAEITS